MYSGPHNPYCFNKACILICHIAKLFFSVNLSIFMFTDVILHNRNPSPISNRRSDTTCHDCFLLIGK
ncbi:unnamed protein product [Linum trigynum]|uniref:Uncharacterized protein n=1 Tax=Linum trigynum TaxID=586398 RepID=A0AAV2CGQ4_9ROSI